MRLAISHRIRRSFAALIRFTDDCSIGPRPVTVGIASPTNLAKVAKVREQNEAL